MRVMSQPSYRPFRPITRREAVKRIGTASAGVALSGGIIRGQTTDIMIGGKAVEIVVSSLSPATVRINVLPIVDGTPSTIPVDGALAQPDAAKRAGAGRAADTFKPVGPAICRALHRAAPDAARRDDRTARRFSA